MVTIKFQGWFECRLATDPDPVDETRGISGYMKCLPGEPDFDRIIRFHDPVVKRTHTPNVGVFITKVVSKNKPIDNHFLIGAKFNLEEQPKFYGYNGIISDDGDEPIMPLTISIRKDNFKLQRSFKDEPLEYPFDDTKPSNGILMGGNDVSENTGIWDIGDVISERILLLEKDLSNSKDELAILQIKQRIGFLKSRSAKMFFNARMNWNKLLQGTIQHENNTILNIPDSSPWSINFWMGGWDPDGLCGYVSGILKMPSITIN